MEGTDSAIYQDIFFQACIVALAPSVWNSLYGSDQRLSVYRHSLFQFGKWRCWFRGVVVFQLKYANVNIILWAGSW